MALEPGTRIGPYEITGMLGAGGMGVVLRATDTELKREVALKMLPASFADDAKSVARFEREAQALAALDHYSIGRIFGLARSSECTALVMELVEGPTLAELIAQGPLPVEQCLDIARQIASALEAAHERGIVHRDLKPANIKLRSDGVVKVLDFGIAKIIDPEVHEFTGSTPATPDLTEVGKVLGTAGYMSPEQARGKLVDKRADIWAFGAVFFELLTGQPAFPGEDPTVMVASVLKSEPAWSELPTLPAQVEAFLRQCLAKDPKARVHDIADVRLALEGAYRWSQPDAGSGKALQRGRVAWLGAIAAVAALAVLATLFLAPDVEEQKPTSVRRVTFNSGTTGGARFTSDGQIVYAASWDGDAYRVFTTRLDSFQSRQLPDIPPADLLAVSATGIAALSLDRRSGTGWFPTGSLARVDLGGGSPRPPEADGILAADFGPEGELAAVVRYSGSDTALEFPPGTVVRQANLIAGPRVSRDGEQICFAEDWGRLGIADRGESARVLVDGLPRIGSCAFSPDGTEVWFINAPTRGTHTRLEAVRTDGSGRRVLESFTGYAQLRDVAADGKVLIAAGSLEFSVRGESAGNERERNLAVFDASRLTFLNASGTAVLISDNSEGAASGGGVFLQSMGSQAPVQIGPGLGIALTPDGETIAMPGEAANVLTLRSTVDAQTRNVPLDVSIAYAATNNFGTQLTPYLYPDFSDDGSRLLLPLTVDASGTARAYVVDINDGSQYPVTPAGVVGPVVLSGDGRSVAGIEDGRIVIYDVDTGDSRPAAGSPEPGRLMRWSNDEEFVYVMELQPAGGRLFRRSLITGERTFMREIFAPDQSAVSRFEPWVSRDGESYAYSLDRGLLSLYVLENIR
jgi:Tol biopolymer transport system component